MNERIERDKDDSDSSLFFALLYGGEFLTKLVTAVVVAGILDDPDRQRYRIEHRLVRTSGLGDWSNTIPEVFSGPEAALLDEQVLSFRNEITMKVADGDWRYVACRQLSETLAAANVQFDGFPQKVSLLFWFRNICLLRNKTKGHGAINQQALSAACQPLEQSYHLLVDHMTCFQKPWAYIKRNLSGKYRVCSISQNSKPFDHLKSSRDLNYKDGVYIALDTLHPVNLVFSDADLSDFFVANGSCTQDQFESLSYITGQKKQQSLKPYLMPVSPLPGSVTNGEGELNVIGNVFTNLPPAPDNYINRPRIEEELQKQLISVHHHPIISMSGRGGIGKTSLVLHVLHRIAKDVNCPYEMIVWFSARDIDLFPEGAKIVRPEGTSIDDFAKIFNRLLGLSSTDKTTCDKTSCLRLLENRFSDSLSKPVLFVFDNFETVQTPAEAFEWIDTFIRPPNKVLITTRMRRAFHADYPIQVGGMEKNECLELVRRTITSLGFSPLPKAELIDKLIEESDGHPFIIKVLLSQWAKNPTIKSFDRQLGSLDEVLELLFERTFNSLSPFVQRLFLTLAGWRSIVPEIAVEAIYIQPEDDFIDVSDAIEELVKSSLVVELEGSDQEMYLSVPLAAQSFGRNKLSIDPNRSIIMKDIRLLQQFGAAQRHDVSTPLANRLHRFFQGVAEQLLSGNKSMSDYLPIIQNIARKMPRTWLFLADLYEELDGDNSIFVRNCIVKYLETSGRDDASAWFRLATLYRRDGKVKEEVHALVEFAKTPSVSVYQISNAIARINAIPKEERHSIPSELWQEMASDIAGVLYRKREDCDATDLSRLAWLYLSIKDTNRAKELVASGLTKSPTNGHCLNLKKRLTSDSFRV